MKRINQNSQKKKKLEAVCDIEIAKKVLKNQVRSKMNNRCAYRVSACYEFEEYKDTYENKIEK